MGDYYEVVHSRVRAGAEEKMLALRPRFVAAMRAAVPGLLDARLVRLKDGTWLDIVRWDSRASAEAGAAAHEGVPEAAEMAGHVIEIIDFMQGDDAEPVAAGH
jgi:hypothetical protein